MGAGWGAGRVARSVSAFSFGVFFDVFFLRLFAIEYTLAGLPYLPAYPSAFRLLIASSARWYPPCVGVAVYYVSCDHIGSGD